MKILLIIAFLLPSCAYKWGSNYLELPGGFKSIHVPVFDNQTDLLGAEVFFTNALKYEFELSKVAKLRGKENAEAELKGVIEKIETISEAQFKSDSSVNQLPRNTVLDTSYRLIATVRLGLMDSASGEKVWERKITSEKVYDAPQLTNAAVNASNPLYNESAKRQFIELLAKEMMREAHSQLSERF